VQKTMNLKENQENFKELKAYIEEHKGEKGMLMQTLHKAQKLFGYLPIEVQKFISDETNTPMAEIYGVATFYTQFSLTKKGKHVISVCMGTACYVKNAQLILDKLKKELYVEEGETTKDELFTLDATRCLGCCGLAPVIMIGEDVYGKITPDDVPKILAKYK